MNKRIKELAKQATEEVMKNTPSFLVTNEMWQEKFAELIVRECSWFVYNYPEKYMTRKQSGEICLSMEEHFGVEE